jgi:hypothetical protein
MADSPRKEDDRSLVSGFEEHEVRYFAGQHGISLDAARELLRRHGDDRGRLYRAAQKLKRD